MAFAAPISWTFRVNDLELPSEISGSGYNLANLAAPRNINAEPGADLWLQILGVVGGSLTLVSTWDGAALSKPTILRELPGGRYGGQGEVAPFDFNGDGRADAIMSEAWGTPSPVIRSNWISLSKPGIEGYERVEWRAPFEVDVSHGADMNGDGKTDLFFQYSGPCGWSIIVQTSNGDGTFALPIKYRIDAIPSSANASVAGVNVSGDAAADLLRVELLPEGVAVDVATNRGEAGFSASTRTLFANRNTLPQVADIDGDSKVDIAFVSAEGAIVHVEVAFAQGNGKFAALVSWDSLSAGSIEAATAAYLHDLNDDGRADLLASDERVAAGRGDGSFVDWQAISGLAGQVADINGDGKSDVLRWSVMPGSAGWDLQLRLRQ